MKELVAIKEALDTDFGPTWNVPSGRSLNLATYHVTYLDPILFSALYFLHNVANKRKNLGDRARRVVLGELRRQVKYYSADGSRVVEDLQDESTLWWGVVRLLKEGDGAAWRVRDKRRLFALLTLLANRDRPKAPSLDAARKEATFEIHNEVRTRLWIVRNCLYILDGPGRAPASLQEQLRSLVGSHLAFLVGCDDAVFDHCYFAGAALEVGSAVLGSSVSQVGLQGRPASESPKPSRVVRIARWSLRHVGKLIMAVLASVIGGLLLIRLMN